MSGGLRLRFIIDLGRTRWCWSAKLTEEVDMVIWDAARGAGQISVFVQ